MRNSYLFGYALGALMLLSAVAGIPDNGAPAPTAGLGTIQEPAAAMGELDAICAVSDDSVPGFSSVFDQVQSNACGCRDLCRNDFQCVLQHGPGSQCVPVGPCDCKECTATQ